MTLADKLLESFGESIEAVGRARKVDALQKKIMLLRNEINAKSNTPEEKAHYRDQLHDAERRLRVTRAA